MEEDVPLQLRLAKARLLDGSQVKTANSDGLGRLGRRASRGSAVRASPVRDGPWRAALVSEGSH